MGSAGISSAVSDSGWSLDGLAAAASSAAASAAETAAEGVKGAVVRQYPFGGVLWDYGDAGFELTRKGQLILAGLAAFGVFKMIGGR